MEDQIRKIVREEIARALSAAGEVADGALSNDPYQDTDVEDTALGAINKVMERVARDVLANTHPVLSTEHAASTEPVHTITAVPERARAACTCHRHTHVMGHDDRCGAPFCYCLSPVRARPEHTVSTECTTCGHTPHASGECTWWGENPCFCTEHTDAHASTEAPRTCTACEHGEHDQGKCGMHVYLRGVASPCPCLASRTLGAHRPEGSRLMCTVCEHARHGAGGCGAVTAQGTPFAAPCECSGVRP
jgi:hypothetical protein